MISRGNDLGRDKQWYLVGRVGDPGDSYPVELAKAYLVVTTQVGTVEFVEPDVSAAPPAPRIDESDDIMGSNEGEDPVKWNTHDTTLIGWTF